MALPQVLLPLVWKGISPWHLDSYEFPDTILVSAVRCRCVSRLHEAISPERETLCSLLLCCRHSSTDRHVVGVASVGEPVWILMMEGQNDALVTFISLESSFPSTSVQVNLEDSLCLPAAALPCRPHFISSVSRALLLCPSELLAWRFLL